MIYWNPDAKMWWVDSELPRVHKWMVNHIDAIDYALTLMPRRKFCIQAGSYLGMWPVALSRHFSSVMCFEPIEELVRCTRLNLRHAEADNVELVHGCLGNTKDERTLARKHGGRSTLTELGHDRAPGVRIDDLDIPRVDALFLDVERSELEVLDGAAETIARDRPVIVLEVLTGQDQYHEYMKALGYTKAGHSHNDWVYTP